MHRSVLSSLLLTTLLFLPSCKEKATLITPEEKTTEQHTQPELPTLPETPEKPDQPTPPKFSPSLSMLAEKPDWPALEAYQHTITRSDFEKLLTQIFTTDDTWKDYIQIHSDHAEIITTGDPSAAPFLLKFADTDKLAPVPRTWQDTTGLPVPPADKPLSNLHIAIDPGHLGGEWAKIEERWFQIDDGTPVTEGDMTLFVAKLLKPQLEAMGAKVTLVRTTTDPVTPYRPSDFTQLAKDAGHTDLKDQQKFTERLFYRTAEIRARAELVNQSIKPDLVLCLHFNATGWGDPDNPSLVPVTHFHLLLNGAYTSDEVRLEDQRFAMLAKLLQRTHEEEALVGKTVAEVFAEISGLPAYTYGSIGVNVQAVPGSPYLYARNLLANRLYNCPVIFMEPYIMNSTHDYHRIQAGDYEGLREINGEMLPSIFREYADALAKGLAKHYGRE